MRTPRILKPFIANALQLFTSKCDKAQKKACQEPSVTNQVDYLVTLMDELQCNALHHEVWCCGAKMDNLRRVALDIKTIELPKVYDTWGSHKKAQAIVDEILDKEPNER